MDGRGQEILIVKKPNKCTAITDVERRRSISSGLNAVHTNIDDANYDSSTFYQEMLKSLEIQVVTLKSSLKEKELYFESREKELLREKLNLEKTQQHLQKTLEEEIFLRNNDTEQMDSFYKDQLRALNDMLDAKDRSLTELNSKLQEITSNKSKESELLNEKVCRVEQELEHSQKRERTMESECEKANGRVFELEKQNFELNIEMQNMIEKYEAEVICLKRTSEEQQQMQRKEDADKRNNLLSEIQKLVKLNEEQSLKLQRLKSEAHRKEKKIECLSGELKQSTKQYQELCQKFYILVEEQKTSVEALILYENSKENLKSYIELIQAEKEGNEKEASEKFKELERYINESSHRSNELEFELEQKNIKILKLENEASAKEKNYELFRISNEENHRMLEYEHVKEIDRLREQIHDLEKKIFEEEITNEKQRDKIEGYEQEIEVLKDQIKGAKLTLQENEIVISKYNSLLSEKEQSIEALEESLKESKENMYNLQTDQRMTTEMINSLATKLGIIDSKLMPFEIENLQKKLSELLNSTQKLKLENKQLNLKNNSLIGIIDDLREKDQLAEERSLNVEKDMAQERQSYEDKMKTLMLEMNQLQVEVQNLKESTWVLQDENSKYSTENYELKTQLKKSFWEKTNLEELERKYQDSENMRNELLSKITYFETFHTNMINELKLEHSNTTDQLQSQIELLNEKYQRDTENLKMKNLKYEKENEVLNTAIYSGALSFMENQSSIDAYKEELANIKAVYEEEREAWRYEKECLNKQYEENYQAITENCVTALKNWQEEYSHILSSLEKEIFNEANVGSFEERIAKLLNYVNTLKIENHVLTNNSKNMGFRGNQASKFTPFNRNPLHHYIQDNINPLYTPKTMSTVSNISTPIMRRSTKMDNILAKALEDMSARKQSRENKS